MASMEDVQLKAATDPDFRAQLLTDPKAALASLDIKVPDSLTINVIEDTQTETTIAIHPPVDPATLTATQLDAVAGGAPYPFQRRRRPPTPTLRLRPSRRAAPAGEDGERSRASIVDCAFGQVWK